LLADLYERASRLFWWNIVTIDAVLPN
jgi:hypothetical protein